MFCQSCVHFAFAHVTVHVSELCDPLYYLKHIFVYFVSESTQQVLPVVGISFVH